MKASKYFLIVLIALFVSSNVSAQSTKSESVKVSGNCGMCKERIEAAAKIAGVTKATWDKSTKMLTVVFNPATVKMEDIQKKVAAVGHDTGSFKADSKTYNALPACCKYR